MTEELLDKIRQVTICGVGLIGGSLGLALKKAGFAGRVVGYGRPATLDHLPRNEEAIYKGGQVYVPAGIDRADVNPRPLSDVVPSNGLIGCFSKDGTMLLATAWEPSQELFQGVIVCLHSDFRLGGLKPNETKRARGVIYILPNDVPSLLARYQLWRRP